MPGRMTWESWRAVAKAHPDGYKAVRGGAIRMWFEIDDLDLEIDMSGVPHGQSGTWAGDIGMFEEMGTWEGITYELTDAEAGEVTLTLPQGGVIHLHNVLDGQTTGTWEGEGGI